MEENQYQDANEQENPQTEEGDLMQYTPANAQQQAAIAALNQCVEELKNELNKVLIGQTATVDLLLASLFSRGHVLLEGVPGIAKTLIARLLSKSLSVGFSRIQFTPDLMPTDVVGTSIFDMQSSDFKFKAGPVFSNFILIDEINRAPAKTQAALFEVMEEQQVTVDGVTHPMSFPFFVIATQNPVEQEGTYKLPEAQLDRFLFRIKMDYPELEEEKLILRRFRKDFRAEVVQEVRPVLTAKDIQNCCEVIEQVHIKDDLLDYIAEIVHHTRNNGDLFLGASPRASLSIMKTSKAIAALNGRAFVTPDDIQTVCYPVLNHRIILSPEREMEGYEVEDIIQDILQKIEVPR